jgi:tetratricopeptide (TPR) repeat protein
MSKLGAAQILGVLVLTWCSSSAVAQNGADTAYTLLVERYLGGDDVGPVDELGKWELSRVERAVQSGRATFGGRSDATVLADGAQSEAAVLAGRRIMAAALLHTECAGRDVELGLYEAGLKHLNWAEAYVALRERLPELTSFCRVWYRLAAELAFTINRESARDFLRRGMRQFPGDSGLLLVEKSPYDAMRNRVDRKRRLETAERLYSQALAADPSLAEARLRRGRTRQLLGRPSEGEADFLWVLRESQESHLVYMAHLFLGRLREDGGDLTASAASYRDAVSVGQRAQAANLGLAHVLARLGDRGASAEAIDRALEPGEGVDPWSLYGIGLPISTGALLDQIQQIRREVRR